MTRAPDWPRPPRTSTASRLVHRRAACQAVVSCCNGEGFHRSTPRARRRRRVTHGDSGTNRKLRGAQGVHARTPRGTPWTVSGEGRRRARCRVSNRPCGNHDLRVFAVRVARWSASCDGSWSRSQDLCTRGKERGPDPWRLAAIGGRSAEAIRPATLSIGQDVLARPHLTVEPGSVLFDWHCHADSGAPRSRRPAARLADARHPARRPSRWPVAPAVSRSDRSAKILHLTSFDASAETPRHASWFSAVSQSLEFPP